MSKKVKAILGILAGVGLAGAGAFALTRKEVGEDDTYIEDDETDDEEAAEAENVEESEG